MKKIFIFIFIIFFNIESFAVDECRTLFEDSAIKICAELDPEIVYGPSSVYRIYAENKKTNKTFQISKEIDLDGVGKITELSDSMYYYKAYLGGNCANCDERHVLISIVDNKILNFGEFAGYEDIDADGKMDFFSYVTTKMGRAHVYDEYAKMKMVIKDNKLVIENK
jgi:hypothetical protein